MPPSASVKASEATNLQSIRLKEVAAPSTPPSGYVQQYADVNGLPHWIDDQGVDNALNSIRVNDAVNNGVTSVLILTHNTTGTPANGLGTALRFRGETSTTVDTFMGQIYSYFDDVTHATRSTSVRIETVYNGATVGRVVIGQDDIIYIIGNGANPATITLLGGSSGNEGGQLGMNGSTGNVNIIFDRLSQNIRYLRSDAVAAVSDFVLQQGSSGGAFNIVLGVSAAAATAQNSIVIANSIAPTGNVTNGISLFAVDIAGSHELRVRDEAGNVTTLSSHNPQMVDANGRVTDYVVKEHNPHTGANVELDIVGALLALEALTGKQLIFVEALSAEMQQTWQDSETLKVERRQAEIDGWDAQMAAFEAYEAVPDEEKAQAEKVNRPKGPRPESYRARPEPNHLLNQRQALQAFLGDKQ